MGPPRRRETDEDHTTTNAQTPSPSGPARAGRPGAGHRAADRPNILWLVAEDFGPELGCYGTAQVGSPNLDRLATQGVRYTRAYTTAPVCSASRSAFMTGMYQTTIGAQNHRSHRDDGYQLPPGVRVISDRMRDAGYYTANVRAIPRVLRVLGDRQDRLELRPQREAV